MSWNDSGNGKNPWKKDGGEAKDLDKIVQDWQRRLRKFIGGSSRPSGGSSGGSPGGLPGGYILLAVLIVGWALTGLYRIDEAERGIVQRFGAYASTSMPGLHWHWPYPVETVDVVNTGEVSGYTYSNEMLTADEAYLYIQMVVQYRRTDPVKYSFGVADPEETLKDVTQSALREVVGTHTLESLVKAERDQIAPRTRQIVQNTLDSYGTGITVTSISLETLDYPKAVQAAVDDTQKARNDRDRYILEADTYAQGLIPIARGDAARINQEAEAYSDRVVANAKGDAARFSSVLAEYKKAPQVTRKRMYMDAVEDVYANSHKVILDAEGSGNLLYLPIEELLKQAKSHSTQGTTGSTSDGTALPEIPDTGDSGKFERDRRTRQ